MTGTARPRGRRHHARQVAALWGVLAVATVACTAMIYASLKPIRQ
jgi:hypothetical protein